MLSSWIILVVSFCFFWSTNCQHIKYNSQEEEEVTDLNEEFKNSPVISSVAVSGQPTELPCNVSSLVRDDSVQLVLWYRDNVATPIYSYDARGGVSIRPKEWADPKVLNGRAFFRLGGSVGSLVLNSTTKDDEAVYRCRVDFKRQTTTHFRVNLTVVEPISSVRIQDSSGTNLVGVAGPFTVGETPTLICKAVGGDPVPSISWWKNGKLLEGDYDGGLPSLRTQTSLLNRVNGIGNNAYNNLNSNFAHFASNEAPNSDRIVTMSTLQLRPLEKEDLRTTYTCRAQNHQMALTKEASIEIDMNFGPSSVKIKGLEGPVSAGKKLRVVCEAKGSRPPATLTWWLDETILASTSQVTSLDGKISTSTLEITLKPSDEGHILTCRAENGHLPAAAVENSVTLQILYPPEVSLQPGSSLNLNNIKEGDDVYFDCHVKARPKASKISWMFNGKELEQDLSSGIMIVGESLVLQKVSKKQAGNYSCIANNTQGSNSSVPITLSVKYAPICRVEQTDVYGVGRLEKTTVTCRVEANPPATSYRWAFNNTGEFVDIPTSHYAIKRDDGHGQRSDLRYSPISDLDYGTLLCWASNEVGVQKIPCTFTVFPAGKPDSVVNCKQFNHTEESVSVICEPGYGGGMNQSFLLEAWDEGSLRAIDRSETPSLEVTGLRPGTRYILKVYAENSMGRSQPTVFNAFTLTDVAERRTAIGVGSESEDLSPVLGSIIGGVSCFIILIIVGITLAKCKLRRNAHANNRRPTATKPENFKSTNLNQEITKVESPIQVESVAGEGEGPQVCDLVSTSQDSMLMSRSQDSTTPLIVSTKPKQYQNPTPPPQFTQSSSTHHKSTSQLHTPSQQYQTQTLPHHPDQYFGHREGAPYSKMSLEPLEPSSFKEYSSVIGNKALPYRQLRNLSSQHPVSYVPVLDYQTHLQREGIWRGEISPTTYTDEKEGVKGVGLGPSGMAGCQRSGSNIPTSVVDPRRNSSYITPMGRSYSREDMSHGEDVPQRHFQMSPTDVISSQQHLHQSPAGNFQQTFSPEQRLTSPLSLESQQESSV